MRPDTHWRAYVWSCEDDECGCTEAGIGRRVDNRFRVAWTGTYFTDHESGAYEELEALSLWMRNNFPDQHAAITWPDFTWHVPEVTT